VTSNPPLSFLDVDTTMIESAGIGLACHKILRGPPGGSGLETPSATHATPI